MDSHPNTNKMGHNVSTPYFNVPPTPSSEDRRSREQFSHASGQSAT